MQNVREKLRRKLSMKDPQPNLNDYDDESDVDDETYRHMQKEMRKAEENHEEPYGKQGSFINKLIVHGNKKTEDEIVAGGAGSKGGAMAKENTAPVTTGSASHSHHAGSASKGL
ncbi:hypothetical protein LTR53_007418 [Teratosphaeriaceae sp. CCFEE 6253]|nr:hypothetical protein LTR53_007418 [Teratosphaeriaceae sp. CCFEE 6253]